MILCTLFAVIRIKTLGEGVEGNDVYFGVIFKAA